MVAALAAGVAACWWLSPATAQERVGAPAVTVAILPSGVEPADLDVDPALSVGAMSAGLASVTKTQTYLDIGAGNRVFTSLYDSELVEGFGFGPVVPGWDAIVRRAEGAPAEIVPGLLGGTLRDAGIPVGADSLLAGPALIAVDREGRVRRTPFRACLARSCPGLSVVPAQPGDLARLAARLAGEDLLIAIERPPPGERESLAIAIAGEGFGGENLRSDTTRADGYVTATDIAPTVLERYGIAVPDEMSGRAIEAGDERDVAAVGDRAERMSVVSGRRGPVVIRSLIAWALLALLAALLSRGRAGPLAFSLLGLATVYLPLLLLLGAALEPSELGERLLVGLGAPALAALTLAVSRGWAALAIACSLVVAAYAVDVIAGSALVTRSLLGPNPALGVRFFGIGNELEAVLAILVPVGVGAALAAVGGLEGREPGPRAAAIAFLAAGAAFAAVFAAGRFGADVGAAIVLPAGAAAAALAVPGALRRRRLVAVAIGAPVLGVAALAAMDLALGGDAHLSRSVLEAGGRDELADVIERRLRLSASSFGRSAGQAIFWFALAAIAVSVWQRRRIGEWLGASPLARAGFAGAAAAICLGVVANDSGALFLIIGSIGLLGCLSFGYAQFARSGRPPRAR